MERAPLGPAVLAIAFASNVACGTDDSPSATSSGTGAASSTSGAGGGDTTSGDGGSGATGAGSASGGGGSGSGAGPSSGCGVAATPGASDHTIDVGGVQRAYAVRIPDPYDPSVPHPLVFALHGAGANGSQAIGTTLTIAGVAGITVGPTALGTYWSAFDDLPLIDALVASLPSELCVDTSHIFAWGYSSGGFMAQDIGCQRADVFRGIGLVEGGGSGGCPKPVAAWITHNQDDMTVPISMAEAARDGWLATNGCTMATQPTDPSPCVAYEGCSAGHPVVWCSPATGGHNPPSYTAAGLTAFFSGL